jgi:predicted RNA-binding protein with EMAP domain
LSITTDNFPPIIIAELALKILRKTFTTKLGFRPSLSKEQLVNTLRSIESSLMVLKYSYLSRNELMVHEDLKIICSNGKKLSEALKPAPSTPSTNYLALSNLNWGILIFQNLGRRMKTGDSNLGSGVDLKVVHVRNVQRYDKFLLTRAYDNEKTYTILTNILDLRTNQNVGIAFLPPREIGGKLSEAMYIGSEEREEEAGVFLSPSKVDLSEVNAILHQLISQRM